MKTGPVTEIVFYDAVLDEVGSICLEERLSEKAAIKIANNCKKSFPLAQSYDIIRKGILIYRSL